MGSADWMPRNLDRRVEIVFPLLTEESRRKADHILSVQLSDNLKAHILMPDGSYEKADLRGKRKLCAQEIFMAEAAEREKDFKKEKSLINHLILWLLEKSIQFMLDVMTL